ncbi:hypothetical protein C4D60_Mb06t08750 [Musa balbisiana]|uniref:Uncharacterized protein n=1 Tax=Musa balbisiana TaxID=52838 RepID=A0A4S8IMD3_MUSBA|nr:hypothetical protein C4D60_Mb06t08750 [Musa balbisiana]
MALQLYDLADSFVFSCFLRISPPGYLRHSIPAVLLALSRLLFRLESLVLTFQGFRHGKRDIDRAGHRRKADSHLFDSSCTGSVSSISTGSSELTLDDDETECVDLQDFDLEKYIAFLYEMRYFLFLYFWYPKEIFTGIYEREKALSGAIDAFEGLDLLKYK